MLLYNFVKKENSPFLGKIILGLYINYMDFLIEILIDLFINAGDYASTSKKVPNVLRYILATIVAIIYIAIVALMFVVGITTVAGGSLGGIALITLGMIFLFFTVKKFISAIKVNKN